MAELDEQIERAASHIDPDEFSKLLDLTRSQPWLESVSKALADLWNLCTNDDERNMVDSLIRRFTHINSSELTALGEEIVNRICVDWGLASEDSLIVATSDNKYADGSQAIIQSLRNKFVSYNGWDDSCFISRIGDSLQSIGEINNIVLVDDFIGTGRTMARRINWYKAKLRNMGLEGKHNLYVVTIAAMEFAKPVLDGLDIRYFSPIWLRKGLSDFHDGDELRESIDCMVRLEALLEPSIKGKSFPSLGYGQSESLFALEAFNVPNNVFPLFWWPLLGNEVPRRTLLRRLV